MPHYLLASVPIHGHVTPLLAITADLAGRGDRVSFLTGGRFADAVTATGAEFLPLPAAADYDDRLLSEREPGPGGIAGLRRDITETFLKPARAQYDALHARTVASSAPPDVVIADPTFMGAALLAGHDRELRPPVVSAGVVPLTLSSSAVAPFGLAMAPLRGPLNRPRNAVLHALVRRVMFAPVQRELDAMFRELHGRPAGAFLFDLQRTLDAVVQLSVPGFEYPRPDAGVPIRFAGPIIPATGGGELPPWWDELDTGRPVVLVTQGTIANTDPTELIRPTIDALADEDALVVVTTGGRPVAELGALPGNVRAAQFLPYDLLFPRLAVFVTNGGYGGVQYALAHGVPLVVAGATEDKPEVAARVAWSGTGIDLRTGRPAPAALRRAVRAVLGAPRYRQAAARLAGEIEAAGGVDELVAVVAALSSGERLPIG
ncbi:glycosyltransferase [Nocardia asteroides]|uniref:glycosyltransferase n=1 Tax=Nocardia asteroides TaxID=1824 RepID=UPI001E508DC8|nr:glycosyltransferase [Nocardia asteroides]UGT62665.1 glycosyltransferase [Nocardia asteroides]